MTKLLALLVISLIFVIVNAQEYPRSQESQIGQTFDEVVVSSDLNVRRKSKNSQQGKRLLSNVPSGTTGTPEKSTAFASKFVSSDGSRIRENPRKKRETWNLETAKKLSELGNSRLFADISETMKILSRGQPHESSYPHL